MQSKDLRVINVKGKNGTSYYKANAFTSVLYKLAAPTDDETLDTDNAVNVLEEPTESQRHYYILDLKLKRLVHVRNIICATHPHPQCHLLQIFKEFMTQVEPRATLRGIILSYKTPPINLPKLAKKCVSRCHHEHKLSPATVIAPTGMSGLF